MNKKRAFWERDELNGHVSGAALITFFGFRKEEVRRVFGAELVAEGSARRQMEALVDFRSLHLKRAVVPGQLVGRVVLIELALGHALVVIVVVVLAQEIFHTLYLTRPLLEIGLPRRVP